MNIRSGMCTMEGMEWYDYIIKAAAEGFEHVELRVDSVNKDSRIFDTGYLKRIKELAEELQVSLSIHSLVGTNLSEKVDRIRKTSVEIVSDVMIAGEEIGAKWVTTHMGSCGFSNSEVDRKYERLGYVARSIEDILSNTAGCETKLAVENMPRYLSRRGNCRLGDCVDELKYFFDILTHDNIKLVFDIAHARINNYNPQYIKEYVNYLGSQIIAIHAHWNNRKKDLHLPLTIGAIKEYTNGFEEAKGLDPIMYWLFECYSMRDNIKCQKLLKRYKDNE